MQDNNYSQYVLITDLFSSLYTLPDSNLIDDNGFSNIKFFLKKLLKPYKNLSYVKLINLSNNKSKLWIIKNNKKSIDISNYFKFINRIIKNETMHHNYKLIKNNINNLDPTTKYCLQELITTVLK